MVWFQARGTLYASARGHCFSPQRHRGTEETLNGSKTCHLERSEGDSRTQSRDPAVAGISIKASAFFITDWGGKRGANRTGQRLLHRHIRHFNSRILVIPLRG